MSLYYNPTKLLSHNKFLNFVIGERNFGKTYGFKKWLINRAIKHGEQFIYLRRYKNDLKKFGQFFDDVGVEFPEHEFKVVGRTLYTKKIKDKDWQEIGIGVELSGWQSNKSYSWVKYKYILFDEFLLEKDYVRYIPNEAQAFMNFVGSAIRDRDGGEKIFCLANSTSLINPYFLFWNITPKTNKEFSVYDEHGIIVQITDSGNAFKEHIRNTPVGKLQAGTEYEKMSVDNEFVNDDMTFVIKRSKESKHQFNIIWKGFMIGFWFDKKEGIMYASQDNEPSSKHTYVLLNDDMKPNVFLIKGWRENYHLFKLVNAFKQGFLCFDNLMIKDVMFDVFQKLRIY